MRPLSTDEQQAFDQIVSESAMTKREAWFAFAVIRREIVREQYHCGLATLDDVKAAAGDMLSAMYELRGQTEKAARYARLRDEGIANAANANETAVTP